MNLTERLRARTARVGPLRFDEFMEAALYGEGGFFTSGIDRAGRRGDFVTSVELGGLFGRLLARRLWSWADANGARPVRVADVGGGAGTLAGQLRDGGLDAVVVDRSTPAREAAAAGVPAVAALAELPWQPDVVIAHELLDNLPARLLYGADAELRVGFDLEGPCLYHSPLDEALLAYRDRWLGDDVAGVAPAPVGASAWLEEVSETLARPGLLVIVDYGEDLAVLARREDWPVRGYRAQREVDPIAAPGETDVTCDVPIDVVCHELEALGFRVERSRQGDWLRRWGIQTDRDAAAADAREAAVKGDAVSQLRATDLRGQAAALTADPGLGAFWVLEASR